MKNDDLISRQAAIDAMSAVNDSICEQQAIDALWELPSLQPERKKGKWIKNGNGTYSCSLCQSWIPNEQWYYANYCLCCGADMREEKTDETN